MTKPFVRNQLRKNARSLAVIGLFALNACDGTGSSNLTEATGLDGLRLDQSEARYQILGRHVVTVAANPQAGTQLTVMAQTLSVPIDEDHDPMPSQEESVYRTCQTGALNFSVQIFGGQGPGENLRSHLDVCDGASCDTGYLIAYQEPVDDMGLPLFSKKGFQIQDATQALVLQQYAIPETMGQIAVSDLGDLDTSVMIDCDGIDETASPTRLVFEYVAANEGNGLQDADSSDGDEEFSDAPYDNPDQTMTDGNPEIQPTADIEQEESYAFICHEYDGTPVTMMIPEPFVPGYLEQGAETGFCENGPTENEALSNETDGANGDSPNQDSPDENIADDTAQDEVVLDETLQDETENAPVNAEDGNEILSGAENATFDETAHVASDWEIIDETTGELAWYSYDDENNLTTVSLADGFFVEDVSVLSSDGEYGIRVRYVDGAGNFSEWSEWAAFIPTVIDPVEDAITVIGTNVGNAALTPEADVTLDPTTADTTEITDASTTVSPILP